MDFSQNMLLPKGFVINSDDIYKEIASYPVVPPEKIKEYWSVYTTTFRRLIDPTANRLENFWWHVWGSDRKNLSGKTLARIFEEISTGPTIAPLRGPPNRWEPPVFGDHPPPWERNKKSAEPSVVSDSKSTDSSAEAGVSAARPPPHPILKKSRGDSKTGPRPTARFAFPDDDDNRESGEASSESVSTAGTEMQRSSSGTKHERRKGPAHKKQFHTSTAAKRRPGLARRISSQTSASSETAAKDEGSAAPTKEQGQPDAIPGAAGGINAQPHAKTSAPAAPEKPLSSKAAGKRPAARPGLERRTSQEAARSAAGGKRTAKVPHTRSLEDVREQPPPQKTPPQETGGGRSNGSAGLEAKARPPLPRSQSHAEPPRRAKVASARTPPRHTLAAEATASTTTVAAQGTMTEFDGRQPPPMVTVLEAEDDELPRDGGGGVSPLDAKFVPTQPSLAPAPPLGRSMSQLTLLLEREKERLGEKAPRG